jgi:tetratricopeptide (TPR) repeat protein
MRLQRNVWLLLVAGVLVFVQPVYAGQCDDMNAKARAAFASAREASIQKNYDRAAELYEEAGKYYEEVANMQNCRCPEVPKNAQGNAKLSRDAAAQARLAAQYRVAMGKYDEGTAFANKMKWDEAIAAFEEAAQIWDGVGAATQSELGKTALESANTARDAAQRALSHKNNNQAWELVKGK